MTHVTVTINGRQFRLACEDGQEAHLTRLATGLDKRIEDLRAGFPDVTDETRLTVMAALSVADELAEVFGRLRKIEAELASLQDARVTSAERAKATQAAVSAALTSAAERIESMTRRLNQTVGDAGIPIG